MYDHGLVVVPVLVVVVVVVVDGPLWNTLLVRVCAQVLVVGANRVFSSEKKSCSVYFNKLLCTRD
jgi:hypothetical protein